MPKRGKKGSVAEEGEEPKIGKIMKWVPPPRGCDGGISIDEREVGTDSVLF